MEVAAIDIHVHPRTEEFTRNRGARGVQMAAYFGRDVGTVSFSEMADQYRERKMMAVLQNSTADPKDPSSETGPNDVIARAVNEHPDVFIGFGVSDPFEGEKARDEIRRCAEELGMRGIGELNPGRQFFYPNDKQFY